MIKALAFSPINEAIATFHVEPFHSSYNLSSCTGRKQNEMRRAQSDRKSVWPEIRSTSSHPLRALQAGCQFKNSVRDEIEFVWDSQGASNKSPFWKKGEFTQQCRLNSTLETLDRKQANFGVLRVASGCSGVPSASILASPSAMVDQMGNLLSPSPGTFCFFHVGCCWSTEEEVGNMAA